MSIKLVNNLDGSISITESGYDFTRDIQQVFKQCHHCDTDGSYLGRVKMMNGLMNLAIDIVTSREAMK